MAVSSESDSDFATTPEVGSSAEWSSPEEPDPPSNATIDIWFSSEAPNETVGPVQDSLVTSFGSSMGAMD